MRTRSRPPGLPGLLALALLVLPANAAESEQARRLAQLRAEVENLASEVEATKEDARGELMSLERQQTELEARIRQEEVRVEELRRTIDRQREALRAEQIAGEVLTPVLKEGLQAVRESIRAGLPYRLDERIEAVDKLENQLDADTLTPQRATTRVW
jgi:septal ring factor EnvC (AmiA/AmiB activator)